MLLYYHQIEDLLQIISKNQLMISSNFSEKFINKDDENILIKYGVHFQKLLVRDTQTIFNPLNFAILAESLRAVELTGITYDKLLTFVRAGNYIPQSEKDIFIVGWFNNQPLEELKAYPNYVIIRNEIIEGITEKKTTRQIASNIGHKTGVWNLDELISHYHDIAISEAKVLEIKKRRSGDIMVYKHVDISGCCQHCVRIYLTNGLRSEPKIFVLSTLEENGSNDGKKPPEWKPTVHPTHISCTCDLHEYSDAYLWSDSTQSYSIPDPDYIPRTASKRPLIRVLINGKEHWL